MFYYSYYYLSDVGIIKCPNKLGFSAKNRKKAN